MPDMEICAECNRQIEDQYVEGGGVEPPPGVLEVRLVPHPSYRILFFKIWTVLL